VLSVEKSGENRPARGRKKSFEGKKRTSCKGKGLVLVISKMEGITAPRGTRLQRAKKGHQGRKRGGSAQREKNLSRKSAY